ncbi:MAG: hypothetical protein ACLQBD_31585 [Syntrophobacteraceae bacterium]
MAGRGPNLTPREIAFQQKALEERKKRLEEQAKRKAAEQALREAKKKK